MNANPVKIKDYENERPWEAKKTKPIKPNLQTSSPYLQNMIENKFLSAKMTTNRLKVE